MFSLTYQERKVLFFVSGLFALGLALAYLKKSSGAGCALSPLNAAAPASHLLDINTATREELVALPWIGEKTADAIISHRESQGPFSRLEDLKSIRGMTERKIDRLRDYLSVKQES